MGDPNHHSQAEDDATTQSTPVWASMVLSFLCSVGTFVGTTGMFYLTKGSYAFSDAQNYLLGVIQGATYIAGALLAQRIIRALAKVGISARGTLLLLMLVMAALALVPFLVKRVDPASTSPWPVWFLMCTYSPLTGVLWPIIESFVSGGLRGERLRSTVGWWNVVWSSALVAASLAVAPFVKERAADAFLGLCVVHVVSAGLVAWALSKEPAAHAHDDPHVSPPVYRELLVTFRLLLPASYLVSSTLLPYLPSLLGKVGVREAMTPIVGGTWLLARVFTFTFLQRWAGWHGKWSLPGTGATLLLAGFGLTVLSVRVATGGAALAMVVGGLFVYGVGMASVYTGAIYYAMEVGSAEVDAGGTHEALIGVGYTAGPLLGLAGVAAVDRGLLAPERFEPVLLVAVAVIGIGLTAFVLRRISGLSKGTGETPVPPSPTEPRGGSPGRPVR